MGKADEREGAGQLKDIVNLTGWVAHSFALRNWVGRTAKRDCRLKRHEAECWRAVKSKRNPDQ